MLSVFGGKLTTYRRLAEAAMAKLAPFFPGMRGAWTAGAPLPGGDFPYDGVETVRADLQRRYPFLPSLPRAGWCAPMARWPADMLGDARDAADLGRVFGADLSEREVDWLVRTEWARTAEDVLWRRSKLGLRFSAAGRAGTGGISGAAAGGGRVNNP